MTAMLQKVLRLIVGNPQRDQNGQLDKGISEKEIIRLESAIGRKLFGPIPTGHQREFFCLDPHTWVWHEVWTDEAKKQRTLTTRYEVHPNGILKVQENHPYQFIDGEELRNFDLATQLYRERVMRQVYRRDPDSGQPLMQTPTPATIR